MSLANHPNFHACQFVTDIVDSFYRSLRGPYFLNGGPRLAPNVKNQVAEFVAVIESIVDKEVENHTKQK